jgi:two-component system, OmpR family, sensor kinase
MFSSLRSRLWISYTFLTMVALLIVAAGLVWALQRSPLLYRSTILKLRVAESVVTTRLEDLPFPNGPLAGARIENMLRNQADARQLRISVLGKDGDVIADFGVGIINPLPVPALPLTTTDNDPTLALLIRDSKGVEWFYILHQVDQQHFLMISTPRPSLPLVQILRDELLRPFFQAALAALVLGLLLSLFFGQWISTPLHHMAEAARQMAEGKYSPIHPSGPSDTRQLAETLNEMAHRVDVSQQSQRDFIANISHELKTPLTSIQGFAQAILDGAAQTPEALQQAAGVIFNEAGRMHRLVMDLLVLARLEGGTADLQKAPVDLELLLNNVVDKFKLQAEQAQVRLFLDKGPLSPIIGDGDRLSQVFTNLVDNALKFTPQGGQVAVAAAELEGNVLVKVKDSGVGISPEDQKRIFERFYQVDKSRRGGSRRGVGLGLAIASQIITAHGGRIWVESSIGAGSTFSVSLPVTRPDDKTISIRRTKV